MVTQTLSLNDIVSRANSGLQRWQETDVKLRIQTMRSLRKIVQKKAQFIARTISEEYGRPLSEVLSQEIFPVLEMAKYCEKNYRHWLAPQKMPYRRPCFFRKRNFLVREPLGCIAVFSPNNFPFSLGMMTLIYVAFAGNTVILKPSEKSRQLPDLIEWLIKESGLAEAGAAFVMRGGAEIGKELIKHPSVQKIIFFGHQKSGDDIAQSCIKHSKSFVLESGGGSTAFVLEDADLTLAAKGLAWSAFYANGQSCVSTERIIIDQRVEKKFLRLFKERVEALWEERQLTHSENKFSEPYLSRYQKLIKIAKSEGANIHSIGENTNGNPSLSYLLPTIISSSSVLTKLWQEEFFGPLVAIASVSDIQKAVLKVNKNVSSLGVSIWSRDKKKATFLAKNIFSGMIWINDSSFGLPHLPWGGWGKSGWGTLFSKHSLHEVTRMKWVSRHPARWAKPRFWWNPYTPLKENIFLKTTRHFF